MAITSETKAKVNSNHQKKKLDKRTKLQQNPPKGRKGVARKGGAQIEQEKEKNTRKTIEKTSSRKETSTPIQQKKDQRTEGAGKQEKREAIPERSSSKGKVRATKKKYTTKKPEKSMNMILDPNQGEKKEGQMGE